ncbi:MAG: hypothetical protein COA38_19830 [Fluviicola sp.]|nr:MAG: hypothetical protein COA38_19830 [Fluviicola sp.]
MLSGIAIEVNIMQTATDLKSFVHELAEQFPVNAPLEALDDVIYRLVEKREIESGLADSVAGRTTPVEDVMKEFGINP